VETLYYTPWLPWLRCVRWSLWNNYFFRCSSSKSDFTGDSAPPPAKKWVTDPTTVNALFPQQHNTM